ncbi:MAG: PEP-utilizing enzyme [Candidatus Micrarchaeota archaeon]
MWSKINTRRLAPQMAIAWNSGFGKPFKKEYGISIGSTLQYFDGKSTDYFVDSKEHSKFNKRLEELIQDENFTRTAYGEAKRYLESVLAWSEGKFNADLAKKSDKQLANLYRKFSTDLMPEFYARMWMVYRISNPLAQKAEEKLVESTGDEKLAAQMLAIFGSPQKMNNVMEERIEALKIALKALSIGNKSIDALVGRHSRKYAYLPMYGFDHQPFSEAHFRSEIEKIQNPKGELDEIGKSLKKRMRARTRYLKFLNNDEGAKRLVSFLSNIVYLRDYRDMIREKVNLAARNLYLEIGKRADLGLEEVNLLTNGEIVGFMEGKGEVNRREIESRKSAWLIIQKGRSAEIYSGHKAREMSKKELGEDEELESFELRGKTGSAGFAKGKVRVINSNKGLSTVKPGEIMVTSMTRQDFVPYLRKCAALVTDEGGITSHAAIICREIGIPCVVGTEFATKTFKTGDMAEVDANKGIARRIKKRGA